MDVLIAGIILTVIVGSGAFLGNLIYDRTFMRFDASRSVHLSLGPNAKAMEATEERKSRAA